MSQAWLGPDGVYAYGSSTTRGTFRVGWGYMTETSLLHWRHLSAELAVIQELSHV